MIPIPDTVSGNVTGTLQISLPGDPSETLLPAMAKNPALSPQTRHPGRTLHHCTTIGPPSKDGARIEQGWSKDK
jgi:hypothetical protein